MSKRAIHNFFLTLAIALPAAFSHAAPGGAAITSYSLAGEFETHSYTHLAYALAAFSRQAALGYTLEDFNPLASRLLYAPALIGIALDQPVNIRFFRTNATGAAPANAPLHRLVSVCLDDNGTQLFAVMRTIYTAFEQHEWGVTFSQPCGDYEWNYPSLTVMLRGNKAFISESPQLMEWYVLHATLPRADHDYDGVLAGCFKGATLENLLAGMPGRQSAALAGSPLPSLLSGIIRISLPAISHMDFSANTDGLAFSFAATLSPLEKDALRTTSHLRHSPALQLPAAAIIPDNAIYASIDACPSPLGDWIANIFNRDVSGLPSLGGIARDEATSHVAFLAPTGDGKSLLFASVLTAANTARALGVVTQSLVTATTGKGPAYVPLAARKTGNYNVYPFRLTHEWQNTAEVVKNRSGATFDASTLPLLLSLATAGLTCEVAANDQYLALTLGPSNSVAQIMLAIAAIKPSPGDLRRFWNKGGYLVPDNAESISAFYPVTLFHSLVRMLPGSRAGMARNIPDVGDGFIAVRMPPERDDRTRTSMRLAANELNSLQTAIMRGQPIIQELLLMSAMQSLINRKPPELTEQQESGRPR